MNAQKEITTLVKFIKTEVEAAGRKGCVVGVSGGIDSAVIAALCRRAFPENTMGVLLPAGRAKNSTKRAKSLCLLLDIPFETHIINVRNALFDSATKLAQGNFVARTRMAILYLHAEISNYLVIGTDNKSENFLGFFTKFGDGGVDINPLGQYFKSEVYALGEALRLPSNIIDAVPTAELWHNQTDEQELGFTYDALEVAIRHLEDPNFSIFKGIPDILPEVAAMHSKTEHKRQLPKEYERGI